MSDEDIVVGILRYNDPLGPSTVVEHDFDVGRSVHDVGVRDDQSTAIEHNPRARRLLFDCFKRPLSARAMSCANGSFGTSF